MSKRREIICDYQPYIESPPVARNSLYGQACANDEATVKHWSPIWVRNSKANHARFDGFRDRSLGKLWGVHRHLPAIVVGSGPSLKENALGLKDRPPGVPVLSCLHNFHFLEDNDVPADYYVSLDAGPVTIEEVSEGGTKTAEEYWEISRNRTLLAYVGTDPKLLELWRGNVFFFTCAVPNDGTSQDMLQYDAHVPGMATGGNVLGACVYAAKAIFGCNPIVFLGADFSFSYTEQFHGWDSKYDANMGHCIRMTDVFGNSVKTWPSYAGFKSFFDWLSQAVPGFYVNCTEGGTFGAYPGGNIRSVVQMNLADFNRMYRVCEDIKDHCATPETAERRLLY